MYYGNEVAPTVGTATPTNAGEMACTQ
jgi:hypothetical protein